MDRSAVRVIGFLSRVGVHFHATEVHDHEEVTVVGCTGRASLGTPGCQ
jgi:hypothetical protein